MDRAVANPPLSPGGNSQITFEQWAESVGLGPGVTGFGIAAMAWRACEKQYRWTSVETQAPPGGKIQMYTYVGTMIIGNFDRRWPKNFITHWARLLPSPSKQEGNLK